MKKDVERLQAQLEELESRLARVEQKDARLDDNVVRIRFLREMLQNRRQRDRLFGKELFGEPAWDILLELYLAELEDRRLLVSKLGQDRGVAMTTALRWVDRLEAEGWLSRIPHPDGGRRVYAVLTPRTSLAMRSHIDELLFRQLLLRQLLA